MQVTEYLSKHPFKVAGGVFAVGLLVVYVYHSQTSNANTQTTQYDPNLDPSVINAEISASAQQQQLNTQVTAQTNQINGEITIANNNNAAQVALATLQAQTAEQTSVNALALGLAQNATANNGNIIAGQVQALGISATQEVQDAGIAASVANNKIVQQAAVDINQSNNLTNARIAELTSQTQQTLGAQNVDLGKTISKNQSEVTIAQTQAAASLAKQQSSNSLFGSVIGGVLGVVGAVFA